MYNVYTIYMNIMRVYEQNERAKLFFFQPIKEKFIELENSEFSRISLLHYVCTVQCSVYLYTCPWHMEQQIKKLFAVTLINALSFQMRCYSVFIHVHIQIPYRSHSSKVKKMWIKSFDVFVHVTSNFPSLSFDTIYTHLPFSVLSTF